MKKIIISIGIGILSLVVIVYSQGPALLQINTVGTIFNANAGAAPQVGTTFALPAASNTITWIISFTSAPASQSTILEFSNDNSIWTTGDTSTNVNGETRTLFNAAKFIRATESARSGGGAITLTVIAKSSPLSNTSLTSASNIAVNSVSVGSTPSTTGVLRLPNNSYITARNAANSADINLIRMGPTDAAEIGVTTLSVNVLSSAGGVTTTGTGTITSAASVTTSAAGYLNWTGRSRTYSPADGQWFLSNNVDTFGVVLKFNAVPTIGACGTSPSVAADATDSVGTITIGSGGTLTSCILNFNSAWTKAPKCWAMVKGTTAADARAIATSASTTVLTITPSAAFTASNTLDYGCMAVK